MEKDFPVFRTETDPILENVNISVQVVFRELQKQKLEPVLELFYVVQKLEERNRKLKYEIIKINEMLE